MTMAAPCADQDGKIRAVSNTALELARRVLTIEAEAVSNLVARIEKALVGWLLAGLENPAISPEKSPPRWQAQAHLRFSYTRQKPVTAISA